MLRRRKPVIGRRRTPHGVSEHPAEHEAPALYDRDRHPVEFGRLLTLSDGVFAIALTLLALSLQVPTDLSAGELGGELVGISPMLVAFLVSVGIIALFWFSHHELFSEVQRLDHPMMWLNFAYLSFVAIVPFVQRVQGDYPLEPISYVIIAAVLAMLNFLDLVMRVYAQRKRLLRIQWAEQRYRTEINRGIVLTAGFLISIPLSFVLVNLTIVVWILMIPLDRILQKRSLREARP